MSGDSWKLTLPCTRGEAEAIDAADDLGLDPAPVLMTSETVEDDTETWRLDAYFEEEPHAAAVAAVAALVPSAAGSVPVVVHLPAEDWVTMSQAGLEPLHVGRFFVHAGGTAQVPDGAVPFRIDAGRAFGTGHHETTSGCLAMLDTMAHATVENVIDVGTGTGLLAFAARALWPEATVTATDIDPVAIAVTRENAALNDVVLGEGDEAVALVVADGALDARIEGRGPYDLIIANILAGPLVSMAPELAAIAASGATVLLAGLLGSQADAVLDAYGACGCRLVARDDRGDWTILRLAAAETRYVPVTPPDPKGRDGWALDL